MIEHLKHMAAVRPDGPDRDAARWALEQIEARGSDMRECINGLRAISFLLLCILVAVILK